MSGAVFVVHQNRLMRQLLMSHTPTRNNRGLISNSSTTRQQPPIILVSFSVSQHGNL